MTNLKIKLNSESEAEEVKRLAVKAGYTLDALFGKKWSAEFCYLLLCEDMSAGFGNEIMADGDKPLSIGELRAMVNPMKEYLVPQNAGGFMYKKSYESKCIPDGWIEIPEGAIRARFYPHDPDGLEFENAFCQWCRHKDNEWINYKNYSNTLEHSRVVWQRDQDEPFLTPECTLNDQYAEIEQVRQHKKHERNSSAWDVQVGGDHYKQFQIQPMQFALENKLDAAQQNVIKYIMRHSFKNGKQDLEKAKHYIDLMIEFYYGDNNNG